MELKLVANFPMRVGTGVWWGKVILARMTSGSSAIGSVQGLFRSNVSLLINLIMI